MPAKPGSATPREVSVVLDVGSRIVDRGVEHRRWEIQLNNRWLAPRDVPGAHAVRADSESSAPELLDCPPGHQYWARYTLRLPVGTRLELFVMRPDESRLEGRAVMEWLRDSTAGRVDAKQPRRRVLSKGRRFFRVRADGRLESEAVFQRRQNRRTPAVSASSRSMKRVRPETIDAFVRALDS